MRKSLLALSFLLIGASRLASAEPNDLRALDLAATAANPRNSEGAFATLRSGRIIFCYSQFSGGASDFSPCRIAEIFSDDQGRTWSQPRALFTPEPGTMEMSVSLLRLASGKLALFSAIKHGTQDCRPYLRISTDDGATWSKPRSLITAPGYFVLNNDRVIQTAKGRLIMPLAFHRARQAVNDGTDSVDLRALDLWYYSDDDGGTWTESPTWWTIPVASSTGLQEPGVVELADGSLYSWARTDQGCQYDFRSNDQGLTWTAPQLSSLRSPASPASIKRLPGSSDLLAVFNDYSGQFPFVITPQTYSGRSPLVASSSSDGGRTWRTGKLLESDPQRDYCYTAIHLTGDAVLFAYMANSRTAGKPSLLSIRRVRLAWLVAPDDDDSVRARAVLHDIFDREESWVKIHAAEALIAGGEAIPMRERFLQLVPKVDTLPYRVGVWRVLANTSPTAAERAACVAQVEKIFLDPTAKDRSQAIETLCKLRCRLNGPILDLVRRTAVDGPELLKPLAFWSLRLADEPGALEKICALLRSPNPTMRVGAAYSLRLLRESDPAALGALAQAAKVEPQGTTAYPYLMSAAFALDADPDCRAAWRSALETILAHGSTDARFEACQGLLQKVTLADLPHYVPLLRDPGHDTQVGAALTILYVHARE
ncbi:MAG: sialidase family protein [Opitutaceae bacterium]